MLPSYPYSYLVGVMIFWVAWLVCAALGKAYRSEMRWGTLIAAPFALTSLLFVPQYWTPPSLFDLDQKIRVGIEDFLWAAAVGGIMLIAAVNTWRVSDFGPLNYADTMRVVVPGVTLAVLGYQTILSCLFLNLLQMRRR